MADTKNAMSYAQAAATVAPKSRPAPATRQVALDEARAACDRALAPHLAMSLPVPAPAAPPKPPPNRPPPAASAAAGAGTAAARLPKSPPGAAAAAPQHAGAAQTPPKPLAAGRAGTGTAPKLELPPPAGAGVAVLATTNVAATPKAGAAGDEVTLSHDGAAATRARCPLDRQTNVNKANSLSNSPTEEATENVAAASLPHTARTDSSADFLDDLKEAEAKDEAKAKMKAEKVATSATKKAGKEATAAKKKTSVSPVTACSKQSSAAP